MASQKFLVQSTKDKPYLQPPPGRRFVRSFLFSRRVNAPLAQVHLLARLIFVLCLSAAQLRTINTAHPDLSGALLLWIVSIGFFTLSGMHEKVARWYLLLTLPTMVSLFLTWALFNPVPGHVILVEKPIYSGNVAFGFSFWQVLWLAVVVIYYLWRRALFTGILLASCLTLLLTSFLVLPSWPIAQIHLFHPLTLQISDRGLMLALTKMVGYSGMMLSTVAIVVTSRDTELIGLLMQLRLPQPVTFFLSTVFRALNLAVADYETIYQAQIARAINARPRSFIRRLRDFSSIAVPMVAMMIRRSSEIGDALLARGYTLQQKSTDYYETSPWRLIDWFVLVLSLVLLYLALGPHPDLPSILV
ncbi:energy-coupling factor transporter transmembrane component T [Tengunoibacter tsumagoiensis]|uniref:Energy-coupling factor transporter transmembrane protein EcfT n=1 Tax=Tengunoibacter tsumagoiensis TaxID=2014871 RepID=A0A402AA63_9CHLR|nr:energy-coupling factor transporter transmembrane component T [Tengunoibacter tsumagoiensis]GCE16062.1 hypothetical protein KTT_59210 [Tengunoibacter tsumagoiensis]